MNTTQRQIQTAESAPKEVHFERKIRFASKAQARKAGNAVIKKYASVFQKLAK